MHVSPRDQNGFVAVANIVPVLSVLNGLVGDFEICGKKVRFQSVVLGFETFADGFLIVTISSDIGASVGRAEGSFAGDFVAVDSDAVGCEVGSGRSVVTLSIGLS